MNVVIQRKRLAISLCHQKNGHVMREGRSDDMRAWIDAGFPDHALVDPGDPGVVMFTDGTIEVRALNGRATYKRGEYHAGSGLYRADRLASAAYDA